PRVLAEQARGVDAKRDVARDTVARIAIGQSVGVAFDEAAVHSRSPAGPARSSSARACGARSRAVDFIVAVGRRLNRRARASTTSRYGAAWTRRPATARAPRFPEPGRAERLAPHRTRRCPRPPTAPAPPPASARPADA